MRRQLVGARVDQGQAGAPLDVADEGRAELRIVRQTRQVRALQQQRHPAGALRLGQMLAKMFAQHRGVAAALAAVARRAAEHLGDEVRDMLRMGRIHPREQRRQQGVLRHPLIEHLGQALECRHAASPLVQAGHRIRVGHAEFLEDKAGLKRPWRRAPPSSRSGAFPRCGRHTARWP